MELVARNVAVSLSGRAIIEDIGLTVAAGEMVGLLGPNGAGKSTLMRALTAQAPASGRIDLGGRPIASMSQGERARLVAYLPQNRIIGWPLEVENLVALGRLPWRAFGRKLADADRALCREAMAVMDVAHLARRPATELSGGEQARVLAARAIAQDTPLLIADEPASGLDPAHQISMMMALHEIAAKGRGILVSLHDLTLAARWCDRVIVIERGRVAGEGRPEEVLTDSLLRRVFGIEARIERGNDGLLLTPLGLARREPGCPG